MTGSLLAAPDLDDDDEVVEPTQTPLAPATRREAVLRLSALVVGTTLVSLLIDLVGGWPWVLVVWSVIVIIMLHELGHFVTAKWSGMKATEFFVGFGPRLWSIRRGETEYGFKALPLGGYVKILGMTSMEELDPSDEPRSFVNQSTSKRVLVASAGSIVHVLIAFALAFIALWSTGEAFLGGETGGVDRPRDPRCGSPACEPATVSSRSTGCRSRRLDRRRRAGVARPPRPRRRACATACAGRSSSRRPRPRAARTRCASASSRAPQVLTRQVGPIAAASGAGSIVWQVTSLTADAFAGAFSPNGIASLAHQVTNSQAGAAEAARPPTGRTRWPARSSWRPTLPALASGPS